LKIKFEQRPTCSCGVKMKLVKFEGYYDSFNYWCCDNCDLDAKMQDAKADRTEKGSYA
jgi:hypothetical protein